MSPDGANIINNSCFSDEQLAYHAFPTPGIQDIVRLPSFPEFLSQQPHLDVLKLVGPCS
jgi:hypothetical protein